MTVPSSTAAPLPPKVRKSAKQPTDAASVSSPAPRKRRRRAVGSGAADDCFTCAGRQVSCDRRRPYCTQCLDLGGRCSGYKTTLTWGVGVASRGKLRGLSLPVSGSQKASATAAVSQQQATSTLGSINDGPPHSVPQGNRAAFEGSKQTREDLDKLHVPDSHANPVGWVSNAAPTASVLTHIQNLSPVSSCGYDLQDLPLEQPHIPSCSQFPYIPPTTSVHDTSNKSNYCYDKTVDNSPTPAHGFASSHPTPWARAGPLYQYATPTSPSCPDQPSEVRHHHTKKRRHDYSTQPGDDISRASPASSGTCAAASANRYQSTGMEAYGAIQQPFGNQMIGETPRMRYLIGYYMEVIAPVIVAFDTPTSPFRFYMLELAKTSETLQHAIATLSLSNLRQRRKNWGLSTGKTLPTRRSCQALCRLTDRSTAEGVGLLSPDEQLKEEMMHRAIVIRSVNAQLADPIARRTDTLLATLLVLSIFHMCDTGTASFKSQFAGIRKLFALRKSSRQSNSDVTKWFMRMFTWFDTMTAAVNNRDSELSVECLDAVTESGDEWSLENLAGCDSRLFRLIAQLSRVNQLSQMRPVERNGIVERPVSTATPPPSMLHFPSFSGPVYPNEHVNSFSHDVPFNAYQSTDPRAEFWQQWLAMRQKLESWRLGLPDSAPTTSSPLTPTSTPTSSHYPPSTFQTTPSPPPPPHPLAHVPLVNLPDVSNISESFRYAGLLYLERLANPHFPSSHPRIQHLVYNALHYISAVQSDVFLLWPLFITGAECILESHRNIIRERCSDIQKDSGFVNNLSCLGLLEKIWAREGASNTASNMALSAVDQGVDQSRMAAGTHRELLGGEGFKWRRVVELEKTNDEYIVV